MCVCVCVFVCVCYVVYLLSDNVYMQVLLQYALGDAQVNILVSGMVFDVEDC